MPCQYFIDSAVIWMSNVGHHMDINSAKYESFSLHQCNILFSVALFYNVLWCAHEWKLCANRIQALESNDVYVLYVMCACMADVLPISTNRIQSIQCVLSLQIENGSNYLHH